MRRAQPILELVDDPVTVTKRTAGFVKAVGPRDRTIRFVASHQNVDADHEVIVVNGIDVSRYLQNPVVLLQHNWRDTAVATTTKLTMEMLAGAPALVGEATFPDRPKSDEALADVRAGLLRGVSVGFKSLEQGPPILPGQSGVTHTKTQLLEISLVSLPACPTCLVTRSHNACGATRAFPSCPSCSSPARAT